MTAQEFSNKLDGVCFDGNDHWINEADIIAKNNNLSVSFIDPNYYHCIIGKQMDKKEVFEESTIYIANKNVCCIETVESVNYVNKAFNLDLKLDFIRIYDSFGIYTKQQDIPDLHGWKIDTSFPSYKFNIHYPDGGVSEGIVYSNDDLQ